MKTVFTFLVFLFLMSCGSRNDYPFKDKEEKLYYTRSGGFDFLRIPLIPPYELLLADFSSRQWTMRLYTFPSYYNAVADVERIAVQDSLVFLYSKSTMGISDHIPIKTCFLLDPANNEEYAFNSEEDLDTYLTNSRGISYLNWIDVEDAFKKFHRTGCLPWIPGCQ